MEYIYFSQQLQVIKLKALQFLYPATTTLEGIKTNYFNYRISASE